MGSMNVEKTAYRTAQSDRRRTNSRADRDEQQHWKKIVHRPFFFM